MQITMKTICIFIAFCTFGFVINEPTIHDEQYIENFLSHYGYLEKRLLGSNKKRNEIYMKDAISDFQHFNGMIVTGIVNDETKKLMQRPRCGVKDKVPPREVNQYKLLEGEEWKSLTLTFAIVNYPVYLNENEVVDEITSAFNIWAKYTNLVFVRKASTEYVHISVWFVKYDHGDAKPFDGPGLVLGHAFPFTTDSRYRGQIHLDRSESWTVNSSSDVGIFQIVAHQIGHVLGIDHSMVKEAIMAPYFKYNEDFRRDLNSDDIQAIQAIYGPKHKIGNKPDERVRNREHVCIEYASQFNQFSPELKQLCIDRKLNPEGTTL